MDFASRLRAVPSSTCPVMFMSTAFFAFVAFTTWLSDRCVAADDSMLVGFAKVEVTPIEPVRLSGYASRDKPHSEVADPLFARAMVITAGHVQQDGASPAPKKTTKPTATDVTDGSDAAATPNRARTVVLVSLDSIAVVGEMTQRIADQLSAEYGVSRSDLVICSTHSHAAPHVEGGLTNLFKQPLSEDEAAAIARQTQRVHDGIIQAIAKALQSRRPARLEVSETSAAFATNRRVLKDGIWSGFGIQPDGPVDRSVRLMRAVAPDGELLGATFMYACHATTLGPDFNQVSADWPGLAASQLEREHPGAIFLPVIGCGADANPEPRRSYDDAKAHGAAMAAAIQQSLNDSWQPLTDFPVTHFGYAGLAPEMPTRADLETDRSDKDVVRRRWAETMLSTLESKGRLPETYPAPIHTWQFGDALVWVFLGGEVVVDYQIRLEKDVAADRVWVAAYTDDVFAYVASERMRDEGGYEVDSSMLYYNQPGRWQTGTEDLIERRVQEILTETLPDNQLRTPEAALASIHLPDGFQVELVAAEPEVNDPVNVAFGHDGRIWVVEMSDYPLGAAGKGRVRWLRDQDGDGRYEQSQVFLSDLDFPSSVTPWRDGVLIIAAPSVFFAADRDGDGRADFREELLTGIGAANPQHRASGFEIGLDGWLNFTSGDGTTELTSTRTGKTMNVSGRDVCWNPDTGDFFTTSGHTQFIRSRDEFGNWFGNVNNQPIYHYVIEDQYRQRGTLSGTATQHLLDPPVAPQVFPRSQTKDRFNDLYTFNRFTSACSSIICREPGMGEAMRGAALVCEPVHNLVARFRVNVDGASFLGERFEEDSEFDWFASSDPLTRPVRIVNAPDGTLWVVDMVREVIEHPEWIPTAWQARLDVRAGTGLGRIYRVHQTNFQPRSIPNTATATRDELVQMLAQDDGALRDLAAQQLMWRGDADLATLESLRSLLRQSPHAAVRAQSLGTLVALGKAVDQDFIASLQDSDQRVGRFAVQQCATAIESSSQLRKSLASLAMSDADSGVLLQLVLTVGGSPAEDLGPAMEAIAARATRDIWLIKALALVHDGQVPSVLIGVLRALEARRPAADTDRADSARSTLESTVQTLWARSPAAGRAAALEKVFPNDESKLAELNEMQTMLLSALAAAGPDALEHDSEMLQRLKTVARSARQRLFHEDTSPEQRGRLIPLLALDTDEPAILNDLVRLLGAQETPENQQAALDVARRLKSDELPNILLAAWSQYLPDVRSSVCGLLLERREWGTQLIAALEKDAVKISDLDASLIERLRNYGDRNLMARAGRVLGKPPESDRNNLVNEVLSRMTSKGDSKRGEALFTQHCAVCHRATPNKPLIGAPLENLSNWSQAQWLVAILDPNRNIEPKYHQYAVLTKDGQTLAGVIEDRSSSQLTLATANGQRHEVKLSEIEQMKDLGVSMMPEGLELKMDPAALSDLIAYLQSISQKQ